MKIAPFVRAVEAHNRAVSASGTRIEHFLVHTGQHYDAAMSQSFFQALDIPEPDVDLGIGSGTHAEQVGRTMIAFEKTVRDWKPDWVVVVGDVNATCACSITAKKEVIRLAHIEAGLRSFDLKMPEEINRMVTDRLSDLLFTTDRMANENLRAEGVPPDRIKLVGNVMIDTLEAHLASAETLNISDIIRGNRIFGKAGCGEVRDDGFALMTLHRPSNVDTREILEPLVAFFLEEIAREMPLVWTIHPRTRERLKAFNLWDRLQKVANVIALEPLGYFEFLRLNKGARILLTDSGGLQEESCVLGTPCLTLRENTERPITLRQYGGVSELVGSDVSTIRNVFHEMRMRPRQPFRPPMWDGHAAERIVGAIVAQGVS